MILLHDKQRLKTIIALLLTAVLMLLPSANVYCQTAEEWLERVDENSAFVAARYNCTLLIHLPGGRERSFGLEGHVQGEEYALLEYTHPQRERGIRYLKRDDQLWIYFPRQDRTILVQGHMMREGVQGGDFSYEDMAESNTLRDKYTAEISSETDTSVTLLLIATDLSISYPYREITIDKRTNVAFRMVNSGVGNQPIKVVNVLETRRIGNRIFPVRSEIRSLLVEDKWTQWIVHDIEFFQRPFDDELFNKENLERTGG